jgi:thiamine biosynthesis lipoprotein
MRHVFETMGTVVSLESTADAAARAAVEAVFRAHDERFSLYRADSELSRIAAGSLALVDSSEQVRETYAAALEWRNRTDGAFTANRPDGVIDLNGIVKAQAMSASAEVLETAGCRDWSLNVGGDILVSGTQPDGTPWTIGLVDPVDRATILCSVVLDGARRAVATSGSAERGDHIWRGGSVAPVEFAQVSVIADDIITADVLATAIVAGGRTALDDFTARFDIDVLTVDREGELLATPGFRAALADAHR